MSSSVVRVAGAVDGGAQLGGEFSLFVNTGEDRLLAIEELAMVGEKLLRPRDHDVFGATRDFFAIARDERNRGALVEEPDHGRHRPRGNADVARDQRRVIGWSGIDQRFHDIHQGSRTLAFCSCFNTSPSRLISSP
jgi:hypothetical protein